MEKRQLKLEDMSKRLVNNAVDFLDHSISELETSPKYSVIDFCSAIEIFFKARLLLEHWSLVVDDPSKAKFDSFRNGDFSSVTMEKAIERLENISGERLTQQEKDCFDQVRRHRNKLVHFFHEDYGTKPSAKVLESIVAEQHRAWFYMHRLLTQKWRKRFSDQLHRIETLNRKMYQHQGYLTTKFDQLSYEIEIEKKRGTQFSVCTACRLDAGKQQVEFEPLISIECLVCETHANAIKLLCPNCQNEMFTYDDAEGTCDFCHQSLNLKQLIENLVSKYGEHRRFKEHLIDPSEAYCAECAAVIGEETVVHIRDKWLCCTCLTLHEQAEQCEWCHTLVAGANLEDSYTVGCVMCDGHLGYSVNDD